MASGTVNTGTKLVKLWTNPSPNNSFGAQTINIDLSAYDWFAVRVKFSTSTPYDLPLAIFTVDDIGKSIRSVTGDTNRVGSRACRYYTANKIMTFNGAFYNSSPNNDICIPLEIYGIKL